MLDSKGAMEATVALGTNRAEQDDMVDTQRRLHALVLGVPSRAWRAARSLSIGCICPAYRGGLLSLWAQTPQRLP